MSIKNYIYSKKKVVVVVVYIYRVIGGANSTHPHKFKTAVRHHSCQHHRQLTV